MEVFKCAACDWVVEISTGKGLLYVCRITGETLLIDKCINDALMGGKE